MFWPIKNSGEVLSKLKDIGYQATSLSTYAFSTLYTTLPHNLIKEKLEVLDLIERTFYKKEGELYLACNDKKAIFTSKDHYKGYQLWSCQNVCDALLFLLDNIYIRFGTKLYRQIVGIPMGSNSAPLVADLFLFCYERDFMKDLSSDNQADVIKAFNSTSRNLDDLLNIDVPRRPSYGVYISQLIRFARVCSHVDDFNTRNKCLTSKLLKQGYRYHKLRKAFSKFYRRHYESISKFNVGLKSLLHQGLSEPEYYGDLVYKFKKIRGMTDFSDQFRKIIMRYKRIGYNLNVMRQSACLVINPITVDSYAALFNCTPVDRASDSMMAPT